MQDIVVIVRVKGQKNSQGGQSESEIACNTVVFVERLCFGDRAKDFDWEPVDGDSKE